ncbi:UNVERIFIED_CONTAM: hypothetical protein RMT77_001811 [Armadillidium vulgare]
MNMVKNCLFVLAVCLTLFQDGGAQFQTNNNNVRNSKTFEFDIGSQFRTETRGANGLIEGEYGFRTPDGCMHVVKYEARRSKYKVLGTSKRDCVRTNRNRSFSPEVSLPQIITRMKEFVPSLPKSFPQVTPRIEPFSTTTTTTTTKLPSTTTATTTTTSTTTKKPIPLSKKPKKIPPIRKSGRTGKQIFDTVPPPPNMKRPRILSPDDPDPVYSFGYQAPGHGHSQAGLPDGRKKGEYFFDSPDGWRRFVTYEATKDGFFPKLRRERIPGWETSPLNPKNRFRSEKERRGKEIGGGGPTDGDTTVEGKDENGELLEGEKEGKQLIPLLKQSNGCPYYFYTNTKINFHWERCIENGTRVGEYGRLADDGFSHRVKYYADETGFHPKIIKTPLTRDQEEAVAGFTQGAFIIPKIEEEKQETEKRIQEWISQNQHRIDNPL